MATGVSTWSKTASSNASADSSVNWREGQAPSSVNDSARGLMASVAKWRDDISGVLATDGSSTAYTVTSNQGFASLSAMDSAVVAFTPHATNGASPTLSVDGLTAKPLRAASGVDLQTNVLLEGTPYVALYNNANAEFVLQGFSANPYGIPLASGMDYWADTTPGSAYAFPTGQAISRTTYSALFNLVGTKFGTGDGSTTFNLPDKTERVSVMKAGEASRLTSDYFGGDSTVIGATGGAESTIMTEDNVAPHDHAVFLHDPGHHHTGNRGASTVQGQQGGFGFLTANIKDDPTTDATTGITLWSDGDNSGNQNKVGKNRSDAPVPMRTVPPTIVCNYIMRII